VDGREFGAVRRTDLDECLFDSVYNTDFIASGPVDFYVGHGADYPSLFGNDVGNIFVDLDGRGLGYFGEAEFGSAGGAPAEGHKVYRSGPDGAQHFGFGGLASEFRQPVVGIGVAVAAALDGRVKCFGYFSWISVE